MKSQRVIHVRSSSYSSRFDRISLIRVYSRQRKVLLYTTPLFLNYLALIIFARGYVISYIFREELHNETLRQCDEEIMQ